MNLTPIKTKSEGSKINAYAPPLRMRIARFDARFLPRENRGDFRVEIRVFSPPGIDLGNQHLHRSVRFHLVDVADST